MQVSEVMHQDPICVDINDSINKVARIMREEEAHFVPVLDDETFVGIVSLAEIELALNSQGLNSKMPIAHVMSEDLTTISSDITIDAALRIMEINQLHGLVVLEGENPVGLVTRDLLHEAEG